MVRRAEGGGVRRGFTLLEVLLAFVIAAPAMTILAWASMDGLLTLQAAGRTEEALARARSRLAVALHGAPLQAGTLEGDDGGGFRWRVQVRPAEAPTERPLGSRGQRRLMRVQTMLYAVAVQVQWSEAGKERAVQLETLQVASRLQPRGARGDTSR